MKGDGKLVPRMSNFYVKMDAYSMHTMKIPKKFAKMFRGSIRENVELEGPSRVTWHVKMIRSNNKFALQSGWKDFVTANQIDKNDILVFTYKGNSSFKVIIFDRSGCQKATPFFAKKMETEMESEELNDSSIREIALPHREVKKEIISISSGSSDTDESSRNISTGVTRAHTTGERVCGKRKQRAGPTINSDTLHQQASKFSKMESEESKGSLIREIAEPHREVKKEIISLSSGSSDTDESSCEISTDRAPREGACGKRKQRDFVQESSESDSESDEGEHGTARKRKTRENNRVKKASGLYVVPHKTYLTKAQEETANMMAQKTQKGSDLFIKILTQNDTCTYKYCRLHIPAGFACKVLQRKKKKITLLPANLDMRSKTCTANYCCKNKVMVRYIGKGWPEFVARNGLKQGYLCLFELRKQEKRGILTMVVHFNQVSS